MEKRSRGLYYSFMALLCILLGLGICTNVLAAQPEYPVPVGFMERKPDVDYGSVQDIEYFSKATNTVRKAKVLLPGGYDSQKQYPVMYLIHGIGGNETSLYWDGAGNVIGNAIAAGAREMIVVLPNACANATGTPPEQFYSLEHYQAYDNFLVDLTENLMPYMKEHFPILEGRENTAISGFSMGGRVSLHIGFTHPELFGYIGAYCPAPGILAYTHFGVTEPGLFTESTFTLTEAYRDNTLVQITAGTNDDIVVGFPLSYHTVLEKNQVPHIWYETLGGDAENPGSGLHEGAVYKQGLYNFMTRIFPDRESENLLHTYGEKFGRIGTSINSWELLNDEKAMPLDRQKQEAVKAQYNSITLENEMKPDALLQRTPTLISREEALREGYVIPEGYADEQVPKLQFDTVDAVLKFCYENGLGVRMHALIWHAQTPEWFFREGYSTSQEAPLTDSKVMDGRMEFYIKTVISHIYGSKYGETVYSWDVVNEHLNASLDQNPPGKWIAIYDEEKSLEPTYVKKAFTYAAEILEELGIRDQVSLIYNDYNCYLIKDQVKALVSFVNREEKLCDGIGMQSHLNVDFPAPQLYLDTVEAFLDMGLEVQLTEFDAGDAGRERQAEYLYQIFYGLTRLKLGHPQGGRLTGLTFWGLSDDVSWREEQYPLLYANPQTPKDSYYAVLKAYKDGTRAWQEEAFPYEYDFRDLTPAGQYGVSYQVTDSGSLDIAFQGQYQEAKFALPEQIDLNNCSQVSLVLKSGQQIALKLYDEKEQEIAVWYGLTSPLGSKFTLDVRGSERAAKIGIMAQDQGESQAVVQSIAFVCEPEEPSQGEQELEQLILQAQEAAREAAQTAKEAAEAQKAADEAAAQALQGAEKASELVRAAQEAIAQAEQVAIQAGTESKAAKEAADRAQAMAREAQEAEQRAKELGQLALEAQEAARAAASGAEKAAELARELEQRVEEALKAAQGAQAGASQAAGQASGEQQKAQEAAQTARAEAQAAGEAARGAESAAEQARKQQEASEQILKEASRLLEQMKQDQQDSAPKKVALGKLTAKKKGSIQVRWKKVQKASGYEISYSLRKDFKNPKVKRVGKAKSSCQIKKLKSKKTYYVRVRAYRKAGETRVYGPYSAIKKAVIK